MPSKPFFPNSLISLATELAKRSDQERFECYRHWKLLPASAKCPDCGTVSELQVPKSDETDDKTRLSVCTNEECYKKKRHKPTLFFKWHSIFNQFPETDMSYIVQAIFCFCLQVQPNQAAVLLGDTVSDTTVGRIYEQIRKALQHFNRKYHRAQRPPAERDGFASGAAAGDGVF